MSIKLAIAGRPPIELYDENITLGSDPGCTVSFPEASGVKSKHAVIRMIAGRWLVEIREGESIFDGDTEPKRNVLAEPWRCHSSDGNRSGDYISARSERGTIVTIAIAFSVFSTAAAQMSPAYMLQFLCTVCFARVFSASCLPSPVTCGLLPRRFSRLPSLSPSASMIPT